MKRFYLLPIVCCALSISLSAQENNGTATTSGADDNRILSADSLITTDARLDSLYQTLPEVMITGERPIVKAAQGKLVYDLPRLIRNLPVDNAYDAVKELPGVIEMNGGLQLAGKILQVCYLDCCDLMYSIIPSAIAFAVFCFLESVTSAARSSSLEMKPISTRIAGTVV